MNFVISRDLLRNSQPGLCITDQHFVYYRPAFHRLVCKVVNLSDINLKFLGSIFDVKIVQNF